jgi:hypothetical protein
MRPRILPSVGGCTKDNPVPKFLSVIEETDDRIFEKDKIILKLKINQCHTKKMKYFLVIILCSITIFSHENGQSRAELFKNELNASNDLLEKIEIIDNKYRSKYEKLNADIRFKNSELSEVVRIKPFDEKKAKEILAKIAVSQSFIKLTSIKHHLEIESNLDSFQRMKFNEHFNP